MLKFLKYSLASFLGTIIAAVVFVLVLVIIVVIVGSPSGKTVDKNSLLVIKLDGEIIDNVSHSPLENFNPLSKGTVAKIGLVEILQSIEKAETDVNIKGILLQVDNVNAGISTINEIRNALKDFKQSGKFILSYSDYYSQKGYYLSTVADKVYMNPEGMLLLKGLSINSLFFKKTFEKIGIKPQIIRHGKYKSAIEIFTQEEMSEASKYQVQELVDDIWVHVKNDIAAARSIKPRKIDQLADSLAVRTALLALENGLLDATKYYDEILAECRDSLGIDDDADIASVSLPAYIEYNYAKQTVQIQDDVSEVAVIVAQGDIYPGEGDNESIGGDRIARMIRKARLDKNIKAIVLRINSGGGSSLASDIIWRESKLAAEQKTLVISMGDAAASGGYYIACPADFIVANPTTITGSIGVFGVFFSGTELLDELGVTSDYVKSNENADVGTFTRPMNETEIAAVQYGIEDIYNTFINHVADGRKMKVAAVDSIGQGRVWTGTDAQEIGLVDMMGGLKTAIKVAIDMENLADKPYQVKYYPERLDAFSALMKDISGEVSSNYLKESLGKHYLYYKAFMKSTTREGIMTRLPFDMNIE